MTHDSSNNRDRYAWLASVVLVGVLAFRVSGTMAERDTDLAFVRTLVAVQRLVLNDYVVPVDEKKLNEAAIDGMVGSLDKYTVYIPPADQSAFTDALEGTFHGVGIMLSRRDDGVIEIVTPIENSPAWTGGVLPGDVILRVEGTAVTGKEIKDVQTLVAGPEGTKVTLSLRHLTGREEDVALERKTIGRSMVKGVQRSADNSWDYWLSKSPKIAYVRLEQFTDGTADQIKAISERLLADGLQGMVLDLRFNPGGQLDQAIHLVDLFVRSGTIVTTRGAHRPEQKAMAHEEGTLPDFPLVVLINESSASAAEVVAGSLKDNRRATIVGARSFGKGSVQEPIKLGPPGGMLKITVAHYYLPSGRLVHKLSDDAPDWGVNPDIDVPMDKEQQLRLAQAQFMSERMFIPVTALTTAPTTQTTLPAPATQPLDPQLDKALDTIAALIALHERTGK